MSHINGILINSALGLFPFLLAQQGQSEVTAADIFLYLIIYVVFAFLLQRILSRLNFENPWYAWIPFLNAYAIFKVGDEPNAILWTVLSIVPCINIVALIIQIMAWARICRKLGKSAWLLLLWLVPLLGMLGFLGYLAYS